MKRCGLVIVIVACVMTTAASATEQVYHPVSPTFGGNPLNGSFLLSTAQAQGKGVKSGQQSPDLSGLTNALSGIGTGASSTPIVVIGGNGLPVVPASP
ncbi:MAG: curli assembly protein CsgF [Rhizobiales bacterium]|nr:curli assembly protein CsgF [Hyphomicrobiales bacterium]